MADENNKTLKLTGTPWADDQVIALGDPGPFSFTPKYRSPFNKTEGTNRLARIYLSSSLVKTAMEADRSSEMSLAQNFDSMINHFEKHPYISFLLEGVGETFEDKFQVTETLGDSYVIFGIGKKPRIFSFRGSLLNCEEYDWRVQMIYLFERYLSVSRLARFKAAGAADNLVTITYDSMKVSGALLNLQTSLMAQNELIAPFSFTMIAPKIELIKSTKTGRETAIVEGTARSSVATAGPDINTSIQPQTSTPTAVEPGSSNYLKKEFIA